MDNFDTHIDCNARSSSYSQNSGLNLNRSNVSSNISQNDNEINLDEDDLEIENESSNGDDANENTSSGCSFDNIDDPNEYFDYSDEWAEDMSSFEPQNISDLNYLHPNTNCTVYDAILMIYTYSTRHGLTWEAIEDLARLMNRVIGEKKIPPSKYIFKKKFQRDECKPVKHFLCHKCELYLGTFSHLKESKQQRCPNCSTPIQTDTKYKKNHFVTIPLKSHLQNVLERNSDKLTFDYDQRSAVIRDVHDALYFQLLRNNYPSTSFITMSFSVDGASLFKATKEKSVWPLQFIVNEINLEDRFKRENVLCSAVSYGKTPNMQVFLKPFINEINQINAEGGLTFKMKSGETKTVMIQPMIFTGDILAKQYVLNKASFHGYDGCSYCLHHGNLVEGRVRYNGQHDAAIRTNENVRADMIQAEMSNNKVNGYKGVSALLAINNFDVVWQVAIDKMHNLDLGLIKKMFDLWLDKKNKNER